MHGELSDLTLLSKHEFFIEFSFSERIKSLEVEGKESKELNALKSNLQASIHTKIVTIFCVVNFFVCVEVCNSYFHYSNIV